MNNDFDWAADRTGKQNSYMPSMPIILLLPFEFIAVCNNFFYPVVDKTDTKSHINRKERGANDLKKQMYTMYTELDRLR